MSGRSDNVAIYIISILAFTFALIFAVGFSDISPHTALGELHAVFHHPFAVVVQVTGIILLGMGLIGKINQSRKRKKMDVQRQRKNTEQAIRPVRLYVLSSDSNSIITDLTEATEQIQRIARRGDAGIIDLVDCVISTAMRAKASDIHVEPAFDNVFIKFRLDGMLHDVCEISKDLLSRFVSRLRVLSNLTIFQPGKPQDGRIEIRVENKTYDIRLSILPTLHGEKAVIRLFEAGDHGFILRNLGMSDRIYEGLTAILMKPQGTIFLTGPTGSGKTTTIYASIQYLIENKGESSNIVTIEDPIECEISGINQTQVNVARDLTFASGLRSILRQDPDVIMVGEVRDSETAKICTQAGLTGHMIISSVHADSSVGVFNRLIDMGIEPFLVASAVSGILAQRLVRKNCPYCSEPTLPSLKSLKALNIPVDENNKYMKGKGCSQCNNRGFLGRIGIFELLSVTPELREAVQRKISTGDLLQIAHSNGLIPMREDGIDKVKKGIIDLDELTRVVM